MHTRPPKGTTGLHIEGKDAVPISQTLNILSFNIEGANGNMSSLINLAKNESIICLQETWLWTFEESTLENIIPNYQGFTYCSDFYENISDFQIPLGKGGIAIMWPRVWSNSVKKLEEGNERVQAVEIYTTEGSLCIINVYLPTLRLPTSKELYQENLDMVHHIIQTYANTNKILCVVILMEPCLIHAQIRMT